MLTFCLFYTKIEICGKSFLVGWFSTKDIFANDLGIPYFLLAIQLGEKCQFSFLRCEQ